MGLIESKTYSNRAQCIQSFGETYQPSRLKTNMQTTTLTNPEVTPNAPMLRVWQPPAEDRRRAVPSAAVYKPSSKWTVVVAFIVAVALHVGAVMWVEMQQNKPPVEAAAPVPVHSLEG